MTRATHNRTLTLSEEEKTELGKRLLDGHSPGTPVVCMEDILDHTIHGDLMEVLPLLPRRFADLIIVDPPYNLTKEYGATRFGARSKAHYRAFLDQWLPGVSGKLKPGGTMYVCGDWRCTSALQDAIEAAGLTLMNRITWQREKGRGAARNWKNAMEDIWMAVATPDDYYFNVEAVKQKRRVIAPYRDADGMPRDWQTERTPDSPGDAGRGGNGTLREGKYRMTCPSNFWDDITVPFWSMPENTDHPTQKPEKLIAKLMLASSRPGDVVFDPFLGSGTTSVVARKLSRRYVGVERELTYCLYAEKRLALSATDNAIQGYADGVFWERNSGK